MIVKCPETAPAAAGPSSPVRRRGVHPVTWIAAAALLPLAWWDARQALHDVTLRRQAAVQHIERLHAVDAIPAVSAPLRADALQRALVEKTDAPSQMRARQSWRSALD
jgi:hypothetical protein